METWMAKSEEAERNWWIVDVSGISLGRVSTHIANLLRGKHKPTFTPHADAGDFVVVINASQAVLTGNKMQTKKYFRHSRFFGSLKEKTAEQKQAEDPTFVVTEAVRGMLPTNKLSYSLINKLKVYPTADHPHASQKPQPFTVKR